MPHALGLLAGAGCPVRYWTEFSWENVDLLLNSSRLQSRPVANFSFALDHVAWGLEPGGFHLTNLLIHLAVGGALLWLCLLYLRFSGDLPRSAGSSHVVAGLVLLPVAIFLLHPLNTQAVTFVVQRMTSLAALFTILAFASYLTARYEITHRTRWWYAGAVVFGILGIGSKEIGFLLLPVILLYELCFFRSKWREKVESRFGGKWNRQWTIRAWVGFVAVIALAGWLVMASSNLFGLSTDFAGRDFNGLERLMTQGRVQVFYLSQLIWPSPGRLNLDHDFTISRSLLNPSTTLPAIFICLLLLVAAIYLAVHQPRYGFPLVAYALFHSIEAGPLNLEIIFEHRMYLPSSMLALFVATLIVDARARTRTAAIPIILVLCIVFAYWTNARNQVWADPLEFRADMAVKSPNKARTQHNFALALLEAGRSEEALPVIRRAVELDADEEKLSRLLGDILLDLGRPDEAVLAYEAATTKAPRNVKSILGLGSALEAAGQEEAAFRHYMDTGVQLGRGGYPWEAIPILKKAVEMRDGDAEAKNALGSAYMTAGLQEQAIEQFRKALALDPAMIEVWYNLGLSADALGLHNEAIRAYRGFVERAPPTLQQPIARARTRIEALLLDVGR
jgi:tetratricopeptide (TPR) repeat protein